MKPNKTMYKVVFKKLEGNNYAGGWVTKVTFLDSLEEVGRISSIESITKLDVYEYPEPVSIQDARKAARLAQLETVKKENREAIARYQAKIKELERGLY